MENNGLLARVADGDQHAFIELYERSAGRIYGLIRSILMDPAQSEEVFQEVMLEVWTQASRFDSDKGSAAAWIATIARRRAIDRVRSEEASRRRGREAVCLKDPPPRDEVSEQVEIAEEWHIVATALLDLSALQRETIQLAYYGELTYREVGEQLGVPLGTVKTRIQQGLAALRRDIAAA